MKKNNKLMVVMFASAVLMNSSAMNTKHEYRKTHLRVPGQIIIVQKNGKPIIIVESKKKETHYLRNALIGTVVLLGVAGTTYGITKYCYPDNRMIARVDDFFNKSVSYLKLDRLSERAQTLYKEICEKIKNKYLSLKATRKNDKELAEKATETETGSETKSLATDTGCAADDSKACSAFDMDFKEKAEDSKIEVAPAAEQQKTKTESSKEENTDKKEDNL